jgi:hypothetical protein
MLSNKGTQYIDNDVNHIITHVDKKNRNIISWSNFCHGKLAAFINPLNAELNPICHLLALLGVHHFLHVSRIRVNKKKTYMETMSCYMCYTFRNFDFVTVIVLEEEYNLWSSLLYSYL